MASPKKSSAFSAFNKRWKNFVTSLQYLLALKKYMLSTAMKKYMIYNFMNNVVLDLNNYDHDWL